MDMPDPDGFAARALMGEDEICLNIVKANGDVTAKYTTEDASAVIVDTEHGDKLPARTSAKGSVVAIECGRNDIVPAPNDYKVLLAGYVLYIVDRGVGHPNRSGVLEISGGQVRYRLEQGALDDDLAKRVGQRLDAMQDAIQKKN